LDSLDAHTHTHTRLTPDTGAQPLTNEDESLILAVNGEIYNHVALRKGLKDKNATFKTHSDCEVIMHLVRHAKRARTRN
jgi:asparagine synthetase B (glutamine-hydrolysing)